MYHCFLIPTSQLNSVSKRDAICDKSKIDGVHGITSAEKSKEACAVIAGKLYSLQEWNRDFCAGVVRVLQSLRAIL